MTKRDEARESEGEREEKESRKRQSGYGRGFVGRDGDVK